MRVMAFVAGAIGGGWRGAARRGGRDPLIPVIRLFTAQALAEPMRFERRAGGL